MINRVRPALLAGVLVILIPLTLYLATLDNGLRLEELKGGDPITHQYAQVQGRPSNAPGYPLYTMGGWLWYRIGRLLLLPLFNPTEILSLYSTLWSMAALIILYLLILEVTDGNWPIAALITLFYSFTYFFWFYSTAVEQYTSAVFQSLIIVLWSFRWERTRQDKYLYLISLMVGLCLANLVTVLFIVPPLVAFVLSTQPRLLTRVQVIGQSALLTLAPLSLYAFVYIRGAQHPEWRGSGHWKTAWEWFVSFISTQQGREELTWKLGPLTTEFPGLIFWDFSLIGVVLSLIGWMLLGRRKGGFLFATFVIYLAFSYIDRYGNWYQVIMPLYPLMALGIAVTADRLWRRAKREPRATLWRGALLIGLALLTASRLVDPDPRAFQHNRPDDDALYLGQSILEDNPEPNATVICDGDQFVSLQYLTEIWWVRPDVHAAKLGEAQALLKRRAEPLYATRQTAMLVLAESEAPVHLSSWGANLVAIHFAPLSQLPPSALRAGVVFGDSLELAGYEWEERAPKAARNGFAATDRELRIALYWQAMGKILNDWSVSVRPTFNGKELTRDSRLVQQDCVHPVAGFYPTTTWTAGEIVRDDYVIPLTAGMRYSGARIILYRAKGEGFENLGVADIELTH